jgi:hypothetical protein
MAAAVVLLFAAGPSYGQRRVGQIQNGGLARLASGSQSGQCQSQPTGTTETSQLQTQVQNTLSQLQTFLQQLQSGQITLPTSSPITSDQLQALMQLEIAELQTLLAQLQNNGQNSTANQAQRAQQRLQTLRSSTSTPSGQLTTAQVQALRRQQAAQAATQTRNRR